MKRIESFCVNHDKLKPGMYVSRIDGDAVTYDIRMVTPNAGVYLENDGLHTFEHLFATYVRNTEDSENIIYVGPMGCRTGFTSSPAMQSARPAPSSWYRRPASLSKILRARVPAPPASNVATGWITVFQKRKFMLKTSQKSSKDGQRTKWSMHNRTIFA